MKIKHIFQAILTIISAIILIFVFISVDKSDLDKLNAYFSDFKFNDEFQKKIPFSQFNFEKLNSNEKRAYISIFEHIKEHPEYIKIPSLTNDEFKNVYFSVKNDNPDVLCFPDACEMVTFFNSCFVRLEYSENSDKCNQMMAELDAEISDIVSRCDFNDDYSKELFCHDYIIANCSYNEDAPDGSNAYGALIRKEAYCSGYSRAMMLLLNAVGIRSILVSGSATVSDEKQESHMWNIVWIDSEPYHLDVTWDDQEQGETYISHLYFNVTTQQISLTHSDISVDIQCIATAANYFSAEGLLFEHTDNETVRIMSDKLNNSIQNNSPYIEIMFTDTSEYTSAVESFFANNSTESLFYKILNSLSNKSKEIIDISHINIVSDNEHKYIRLMFDMK